MTAHSLLLSYITSYPSKANQYKKEVCMTAKEAITLFKSYQESNHRKRTAESYRSLLGYFESSFFNRDLDSIKPDEIYHFLERITHSLAKSTRRLRYDKQC